ncbi:hypothetical protein Cgig2_003787 [Carnegiea gigantea]|uniref:Uncharacterized protein n=1 Tax=Carnegiea gigantea TaxID=171969 RepID=A0A9Q1JPC7_9CARY|nr:hypothetical protein Cgig2_003787 [Carnegiea gigantea]
MMILPSPSHQNPSLILGAKELPSFFSESSGFRIQCTLYTASIPLSHPFPFTTLKLERLDCLGAVDWVCTRCDSTPACECIGYYSYLLTETALWRLFPSSESGKKNDDNSGFFNPFSLDYVLDLSSVCDDCFCCQIYGYPDSYVLFCVLNVASEMENLSFISKAISLDCRFTAWLLRLEHGEKIDMLSIIVDRTYRLWSNSVAISSKSRAPRICHVKVTTSPQLAGCILQELTGSYGCMCTGCRLVRWLLPSLLAILPFKLVAFGTVNCIFSPNCMLIIIKIMNTLLCSTQYSSFDRLLSITNSLGLKIVWNVQGAKKTQVLEEVKILKRTAQPDILFLIEAMTNEKKTLVALFKKWGSITSILSSWLTIQEEYGLFGIIIIVMRQF